MQNESKILYKRWIQKIELRILPLHSKILMAHPYLLYPTTHIHFTPLTNKSNQFTTYTKTLNKNKEARNVVDLPLPTMLFYSILHITFSLTQFFSYPRGHLPLLTPFADILNMIILYYYFLPFTFI